MGKNDKKINSIPELLSCLKGDTSSYSGQIWFRGQSDAKWKLQPSMSRVTSNVSEFTLISRFKQNASLLINKQPLNYFDWLFLMQHHGVPTRLLDWTESALTGLFFSVEDSNAYSQDGALWVLKPTELNKHANISSSEFAYIPSFDDMFLQNYDPQTLNQDKTTKMLPIAAIAARNNSRMQAQLGVFTIAHRDNTPIEEIGSKQHIWKYIIPRSKKKEIMKELALLGITRFQLFPELASIGALLKNGI